MKFKVKKRPKIDRYEWHKAFTWLPTKVNETDTDYDIAWGEAIMQKRMRIAGTSPTYKRYTEKEYFKRKLAGEDDVTEDAKDIWAEVKHDGTDFNVQHTETGDFKVTKGQPSIVPSTSDPDVGIHKLAGIDDVTIVAGGAAGPPK